MKNVAGFLRSLLVLLVLTALAAGGALAQKKKEENEFPNATRKEPRNFPLSESNSKKINKAYEALDAGEMAEAEQILNDVLGGKRVSDYEKALAFQGLSQIAYDRDDIAGAVNYNRQALTLNSLDNKSHFNLVYQIAQMNLMDEKYDAALAAVEEWFTLTGATEKPDAWSLKGNALYRLDRFAEAAEAMKRAIALSPKPNESWQQLLIASYYDAENFTEAAATAEALLATDPTNKNLTQQLASIYLEIEQDQKALALLEGAYAKGLLTEEKDLRQLYQLYNYLEKPADAARIITEGLSKGVLTETVDTLRGLADAYALSAESQPDESAQRKELLAKAADAYGRAAAGSTADGELDMQRGHLLIDLERWADAKAALTAALQKGKLKREGECWVLLGTAEFELGNEAAAIAAYKKAQSFPSTKSMADAWLKTVQQR